MVDTDVVVTLAAVVALATVPLTLTVTAPVAPETLIFVPATMLVTPVLLSVSVPEPVVVLIPVVVPIVAGTYDPPEVPTSICPEVGDVTVPVPPTDVPTVPLVICDPAIAIKVFVAVVN